MCAGAGGRRCPRGRSQLNLQLCWKMPSLHATMGLLLLRVTSTVAWTPSAVRLNRLVAGRSSCRHCCLRPLAAGGSRGRSSSSCSSRFRTFAPATTAGAVVDGEGGGSEGARTKSVESEREDVPAIKSVESDGKDFQGVEIQPLLQRHMEALGSAGRRK